MKVLDILSDKIDYLFRRSKNADERTWDFFIRTVTLLILALLVVCLLSSPVGASGNTLISYYNIDLSELVSNPVNIKWNFTDLQYFTNLRYDTENVEYRMLPNGSNNFEDILFIDGMPDLESNYVLVEQTAGAWEEVWFIPKQYIDNGSMVLVADGQDTRIYSSIDYTFTLFSVNYSDLSDPSLYREYTIRSVSAGSYINPGQWEPYAYYATWSNAPYFLTDVNYDTYEEIASWVSNGMIEDYPHIYDGNYYNWMDGLLEQPWESGEIVSEGASNHLALDDFQIGITGVSNLSELMSADVVIGISGDDYIQNHPDEFEVRVDYRVLIKDSISGVPDPDSTWSQTYPVKTFFNNIYSMGVNEIFEHMPLENNSNVYRYYKNLKDTYNQQVVAQEGTFKKGLFPTLFDVVKDVYICGYYVPNPSVENNTIFNFDLEVSISLHEVGSSNMSALGIKKFDFIHGTESITSAEILHNYDPWEGESDPQLSPAVPSSGDVTSGGGGSSNVKVNVDVSGQKIPLGVKTKAQMEEILQNYRDVYGEFDSNWYALADENNDNNFLKILGLTLPEIPGIDYMVQCACVIFGLAVVLFVLKVLLF